MRSSKRKGHNWQVFEDYDNAISRNVVIIQSYKRIRREMIFTDYCGNKDTIFLRFFWLFGVSPLRTQEDLLNDHFFIHSGDCQSCT